MVLVSTILVGFAAALAAPWVHRAAPRRSGWLLGLAPLAMAGVFAALAGRVAGGAVVRESAAWVPGLGLELSFVLDGLSLLFALLICGIGALVVVYSGGYLAGHPQQGRFHAFTLIFMASMLGLVLADNVVLLFVFWELTSVSSYLLIGFDHEKEESRASALQALLVTGLGGLALLAGLLLMGLAGGSFELTTLAGQGEAVRAHPLHAAILGLVLLGAFTKSAQFPFHFWLPAAMAAPTPASAYLHSATMVKAGVYLLARLTPVLGGTDAWYYVVTTAGVVTLLLGAAMALGQTDLKRLLAYSTVSGLGTLVALLGLGTLLAVQAAVVFLLVHALYKAALFLVAGAVDHETGTRDVTRLGGLLRAMPVTAAAAALAGLSMMGLPPLLGFVGKELVYEAALEAPRAAFWIAAAAVGANAFVVAVAAMVAFRPFLSAPVPAPRAPHEAPPSLWLGPVLLGGAGLVLGLLPQTLGAPLIAAAVGAVRAEPSPLTLALWHGMNPMLALSVFTLAAGAGVYAGRDRLRRAGLFDAVAGWGPSRGYELALAGMTGLARAQTRILQSGSLHNYLFMVIGTTVGLAGYALVRGRRPLGWTGLEDVRFYEAGLAGVMLLATLAAVRSASRLAAVAALGVVGYGVALFYVVFGAPDLAMTQVLVDTLTVILFVLVLYHLPRFATLSSARARARDALAAASAGALVTVLILAAGSRSHDGAATAFYAENSLPRAHGRNVVNVILVDFRGLDTLGEITVLSVAGVGVHALVRVRRSRRETA